MREKIRVPVKDTEIADKLMPTTHGFSLDRVPPETKYREAHNRDDVGFVDVDTARIVNFTETVLKTEEDEYDFDVIILPTGFDVGSGALARMNIPGCDGCSLTEQWQKDSRSTLGLQAHG